MSKEMTNNREIRSNEYSLMAPSPESRTIEGYALVFNSESDNLNRGSRRRPLFEVILPEAITSDLLKRSNVRCLLEHNDNRLLARSLRGRGTLTLELDQFGLKYRFEAPHTVDGDTALELVRRGDISGSSFAFSLGSGGATIERRSDGTYLRTIRRIDAIYDVTLTSNPAYGDTSVAVRDMDGALAAEAQQSHERTQHLDLGYQTIDIL